MITTRIAFVMVVDDYHDFGYTCQAIKGVNLSYKEVGMTYKGQYVGVVFTEYSPGDGEIQDLLTAAKIEIED